MIWTLEADSGCFVRLGAEGPAVKRALADAEAPIQGLPGAVALDAPLLRALPEDRRLRLPGALVQTADVTDGVDAPVVSEIWYAVNQDVYRASSACDRNLAEGIDRTEEPVQGVRRQYNDTHAATGISRATLSRRAAGQAKRMDLAVLERPGEYFDRASGDLLILQLALAERRSIRTRSRTDRRFGGRGGPPSP